MGRDRRWWQSRRASVLLVTGGSGFLGRHLIRHPLIDDGDVQWQVVAPPSSMLDVRRADAVLDAVTEWRPHAVVHLAYRRDDRRSIVDAGQHVARAAAATNTRLVHVSTDVVFNGRPQPYTEADSADATADYGRWKAETEAHITRECTNSVIVRTSLLYGTNDPGPQLKLVQQAARTGRPLFFTDEVRCPSHASDVAAALIRLASMPEVTGPLHVTSPQPLTRADFARALARWSGIDPHSLPTTTLAEAGVDRPGTVVLDVRKTTALGLTCRTVDQALGDEVLTR